MKIMKQTKLMEQKYYTDKDSILMEKLSLSQKFIYLIQDKTIPEPLMLSYRYKRLFSNSFVINSFELLSHMVQ